MGRCEKCGQFVCVCETFTTPKPPEPHVRGYAIVYLPEHFAPAETIESKFRRLSQQWRKETKAISVLRRKVTHPAYQQIIGMGRAPITLILTEMSERPDDWMWALAAITGKDQAPKAASFDEVVNAWIAWGKANNFLP